MPSSISNFEAPPDVRSRSRYFPVRPATSSAAADRLPTGMGRAWATAIIGVTCVLGAMEIMYRARGISPEIGDDQRLWAAVRDGMRPDDRAQVALVGSSRIRQDIDLRTFSDTMGGAPVAQLAIEGSDGWLVLDSLSRDEHFRGTCIFDLVPWRAFGIPAGEDATSVEYLAYYAHRPWIAPLETSLRLATQRVFAFRAVRAVPMIRQLRHGLLPEPSAFKIDADRGRRADWSRVPRWMLTAWDDSAGQGADATQLRDNLNQLETMVRRIQARGGQVALVAFPATGIRGGLERAAYPRERYWDVLAAQTTAVTLNWLDDPRLLKFKCPDGSHLDMRDQVEFTRIIGEDLRKKLEAQRAGG